MFDLPCHDVCSIFPEAGPGDLAGLKADIAAHGLREPVWTCQGTVIDGRVTAAPG
jgi:hypothetical protein